MKTLNYKVSIDAPKEKVWEKLWSQETYPEWTKPFSESSGIKIQDWKEGGRVHFTAEDGHGMYSDIVKLTENEYISFRHLGELKNGTELPLDEKSEQWSGAMENYTLTESGGKTELEIEVEMDDQGAEMMEEAFPKALDKLKSISES